ncbi:hypothetical protein JG688_00013865 [Phytophthora aleatoria]|uniref:Uncharacterized protein n=1 Tax=Phytophthora aleatoria TaxID=2496075 RepID=A0A8J5MDR1_9STRA|nr:hypothetical protein JG688_00013865 [Phytophthora aleatoria]
MIGWSLIKRRLVLAVYDVFASTTKKKNERESNCRISSAYKAALVKSGLIGVNGPYFDVVLLWREVVETALQTQQAYKMSLLLPRTQLNRSYIVLLVLNCWSTALVHSAFHAHSATRRLCAIVCDCVLDLVTSVGITATILVIYSSDFDFDENGFPVVKWYEDVWIVHAINEFNFVMVASWGDLIMRVVFALSMIGNTSNMKKLLSSKLTPEKCEHNEHGVTAVVPLDLSMKTCKLIARLVCCKQ